MRGLCVPGTPQTDQSYLLTGLSSPLQPFRVLPCERTRHSKMHIKCDSCNLAAGWRLTARPGVGIDKQLTWRVRHTWSCWLQS